MNLKQAGHELKINPPKILAQTARKKGAAQANKQRIAIMFSKAGESHHTINSPFGNISHKAPTVNWSAKNGGKFGNEI